MKYKIGDKFEHKYSNQYNLKILSVDNGFYHIVDNEGAVFHCPDKHLDKHYTQIIPKAPVKGKVYKVWDANPKNYRYAEFSHFNSDDVFISKLGAAWKNWEIVVQGESDEK